MAHILKNLKKKEYDLIFSKIGKYFTFIWIYLLLITFFAVTFNYYSILAHCRKCCKLHMEKYKIRQLKTTKLYKSGDTSIC